MLTVTNEAAERITTAHRAKLAYVYVRQSSPTQVRQHQESTELQYRLANRAVDLGWPRERIIVIDDDLGKSGASSAERHGFQRLIAEISLGKAGLVLSLDASRLARNNHDWHKLLGLCSIFGVLIADGERLYDPSAYHDGLLLGISGIMSEAELHQIRLRLHQGEMQKASRGELRLPLAAGLARGPTGEIVLNPDAEVQARLRLVFSLFQTLQSARSVLRELLRHELALPVRPQKGPAPHQVVWVPASSARVLQILKNPSYAGAYVYGRQRQDPLRRHGDSPCSGTVRVPVGEWKVCLHDAHPGYISWEGFMANLKRLDDNMTTHLSSRRGVPRKGWALLQGIAVCGCCGRRMNVHYCGAKGEYPSYSCMSDMNRDGGPVCQNVRARPVDAVVEQVLLEALAPDQIELAVAAVGELEAQSKQLEQQWILKRERARYEAERARRQYDIVEPENRLVARSLEGAWEDKLRQVEAVEQAYEAWRREQPAMLGDAERAEVLNLAQDLSRVWQAATAQERKRILRLVVREVILDQKREPDTVWMQLCWQTGAITEHRLTRQAHSYMDYAAAELIERRIRELTAEGKLDEAIAAQLNAEGITTARGAAFVHGTIYMLRQQWHIPPAKINGDGPNPPRWPDGSYSVQGAAAALGITEHCVYNWLHAGRLQGHQLMKGQPWQITMRSEDIGVLRAQVRRTNRSIKEAL